MDVKKYAPHTGRYLDEENVVHNIIEHLTGAVRGIDNKANTLHTIEVVNGSSAANNIFLMLKWYEEENA